MTILYKDIRTFGFKERLYTEAREAGRPVRSLRRRSTAGGQLDDGGLDDVASVGAESHARSWCWSRTCWCSGMPIVPAEGADELATHLKVPTGPGRLLPGGARQAATGGLFHDGIFMAGLAHYPKFLDETIIQAQAAAARAATILAKTT